MLCVCTLTRYYYPKKTTSNNIQGLFQGFFTLIINIEGKYHFFVHFLASNLHCFGPSYFHVSSRYGSQ